MNGWLDSGTLGTWAADWLPVLAEAAVKGSMLLAVAGVAALGLRRAPAAARHLLWLLAMVGLLVLPALSDLLLPGWSVIGGGSAGAWPARIVEGSAEVSASQVADGSAAASPSRNVGRTAAASPARFGGRRVVPPGYPFWVWLLPLWAAGVAVALLPAAAGTLSLRRLTLRCRPVTAGPWAAALQWACTRLGIKRPVRLLVAADRSVPMTWGLLRPKLLLPADAADWPAQRLRVAVLHELAHLRRGDCLAGLVAQLACALYWFHPLVWLARRQMRIEAERACDDLVLNTGLRPADYAQHLLAIVAGACWRRVAAAGVVPMARGSKLEGRLRHILDGRCSRRHLSPTAVAAAVVSFALVLVPVAMLQATGPAKAVQTNPEAGAGGSQRSQRSGPPRTPPTLTSQDDDPSNRAFARFKGAFIVTGTVTDGQGRPMAGVEVSAWCGMGTLRRTGSAMTDQRGHYTVRFGPGMLMFDEGTGRGRVGLQAATIYAHRPGFFEKDLCRQGDLAMSDEPVGKDNYRRVDPDDVVLPGKPRRVDFVMLPAAEIHGQVADKSGRPVANQTIILDGDELPPSTNVLCSVKTGADGRFTMTEVPLRAFWFRLSTGKGREVESQRVRFDRPGVYPVRLVYDRPLFGQPSLVCQLIAAVPRPARHLLVWGRPVQGVRLGAAAFAPSQPLGGRVLIRYALQNRSDSSIRFYGGPSCEIISGKAVWAGGLITVIGPDGKPLRAAKAAPFPSRGIDVRPGQTYHGQLDLASYFSFTHPGHYRIVLQLQPHPSDDRKGDLAFSITSGQIRLVLTKAASKQERKRLSFRLEPSEQGWLRIDGRVVSQDQLQRVLERRLADYDARSAHLVLRVSPQVEHAAVVKVIETLRGLGFASVDLMTETH